MTYKEFGSTGKKLSVFGFGGAKFRNGKPHEENAALVRYAIEKGVNHFDSGMGYANSEEIFALAVKGLARGTFCMSSKNQPAFYKNRQAQLDEIKGSLEKMGLDYFDFYYLNLKWLFGMPQEEFENRLGFHKQWFMLAKRKADAGDCVQCGACERECTQHINIMQRMAELADIERRLDI